MATNLLIPHGFEANYSVGFARGLAATGAQFTVLSDDDTQPKLRVAGIPQRNVRGSLDPRRPGPAKLANLIRYYAALFWTIARQRGATVHFTGLLNSRLVPIDGWLLPCWLRLWAGRYVHTAHNALPHGREQHPFFRKLYRWIYRFPHTIVVHTPKVAEQLVSDFGVPRDRIITISIGLNEEVPETDATSAEARRQLGLSAGGRWALFFGKIEPYKGVDLLIEAWPLLRTPGARLAIVGVCLDPAHAAVLRTAIAASPRAEDLYWRAGFVPNEAIALWLKACETVVLPYRNIYQSGVVFLCQRFGIPMVATNVGSMAEYLADGAGVVAETNTPAGLAEALDRFAHSEEFDRAAIAERAKKYSWDRQCAALRHLFT